MVVGGGYIGVEMAEAMIRRGLAATLITRSDVMSSLDLADAEHTDTKAPRLEGRLASRIVRAHQVALAHPRTVRGRRRSRHDRWK